MAQYCEDASPFKTGNLNINGRTRRGCRMFVPSCSLLTGTGIVLILALGLAVPRALAQQPANVYSTYGVHNPASDSPCANSSCVYVREPSQPTDPRYPDYWSSNWHMYRVFQGFAENPPPYEGPSPANRIQMASNNLQ